jgi:hypothetical protein
MANVKVLAGDFLQGDGEYRGSTLTLETPLYPWPGVNIAVNTIKTIEVASEASGPHVETAIGLGLAGAMFLGPVGAAAGMFLARDETEVTFWVALRDGRRFLAATDDRTYRRLAQQIARPDFFASHE